MSDDKKPEDTKPPVDTAAKKPAEKAVDEGSVAAAAKFVGVRQSEVLSFRKVGDRYIVVTIAGQKLSETPDEVKARVAAAEKAAAKAKKED